ncbi:MAG: hypothetical protein ACJ761_00130, partial [Chloroflexota bacterium]
LTRARRDSLVKEVPRVREEIDQGRVALVGLVRKASWNPFALTDNHQVLAYAYEVDEAGAITLRIYDPNHPDDDGVTIGLGRVAGQSTGEPLIGFLALD